MLIFRHPLQIILCIALLCSSVVGCMVGPNFRSPSPPNVQAYTEMPLPAKTVSTPSLDKSGKTQWFVSNMDLPAEWWYLFHSNELNQLIETGLKNSPNLAAAYASLRMAQEALNVQIGNSFFPAFNAVAQGERELASSDSFGVNTQPTIFNLFNTSVNVSYTLDIVGGARRQVEALQAQVHYQQFELIAAYLTLTSNIVTTAITIASLQGQIDETIELIQSQQNQLNILQKQLHLGGVSNETVLTQQTLVNQTRAMLPPLEKSLAQSRHALSVLIGLFPNNPSPNIKLNSLFLPTRLPVSLPSRLVRQRPDVRASEALLHAASAQIGVATANLFPQLNLTGSYGWQALVPSRLFGTSTNAWNVAGQLTQPLFHGGALLAARREAIAAYDQAAAQYRQTVVQAFQNVADTLRALELDAKLLRAQKRAEQSAYQNLQLTQKQYRLGGVNYLNVLNAQQQYQSTRIARIQAQAARYSDTAALFQALGGGWWHKSWCVKECLYEKY